MVGLWRWFGTLIPDPIWLDRNKTVEFQGRYYFQANSPAPATSSGDSPRMAPMPSWSLTSIPVRERISTRTAHGLGAALFRGRHPASGQELFRYDGGTTVEQFTDINPARRCLGQVRQGHDPRRLRVLPGRRRRSRYGTLADRRREHRALAGRDAGSRGFVLLQPEGGGRPALLPATRTDYGLNTRAWRLDGDQ